MNHSEMVKKAVRIAWPAVLESFFVSLAGMIDTMMVSTMGSYAVAAVGLTTQPKFIGLAVFFAMNVAVSAIVARRKGEERQEGANEALQTALLLTLALCFVVTVLSFLAAEPLMRLFVEPGETEVVRLGARYLRLMGFFYILPGITNGLQGYMRALGKLKLTM